MSVVLVIIGLFIGGIFVGRDLYEVARVRRAVTQLEQFNYATTTFISRFKGLPGDIRNPTGYNAAPRAGTAGRGDGNWVIGTYVETPVYLANFCNEYQLFWSDLSNANLLNQDVGRGSDTPSPWCMPGVITDENGLSGYIPSSPWKEIRWTIHRLDPTQPNKHHFVLGRLFQITPTGGFYSGNDAIPTASARAIDIKIDDGLPATGKMRNISSYGTGGFLNTIPAGCSADGVTYANGGTLCTPYFEASF